jgi:RNA polymerase subunit RPABC4/transcription elongation factor Spt4
MRWRKATWALIAWTGLMALWAGSGLANVSNIRATSDAERAGVAIGTGIGMSIIIGTWFVGFIVLALIWLMSRPQRRTCPVCGTSVERGRTTCGRCGYDFARAAVVALAASGTSGPVPAPGTMPPPSSAPAPSWPSAMKGCPRCGAAVPLDAASCPTCGFAPEAPAG